MTTKKPIALVTPWFGRELTGGAELHAWNIACKLSERGFPVEVLTTCCRAYTEDWSTNHLEEGTTQIQENLKVLRFPVSERNKEAFDRVCSYLLSIDKSELKPGVTPISNDDEIIFRNQLINAKSLVRFLEENSEKYATFMFLPYLYGPVLEGLPKVYSKSVLIPCLHDESYAYLNITQNIFYKAKNILWLSEGEYELGIKLYGPGIIEKSIVAGAGIESELLTSTEPPVPDELKDAKSFILTLGRKDKGKGVHFLMEAFRTFKRNTKSKAKLVIAGPGAEDCNDREYDILDLGFVSNEQRHWLLDNCVALAQPSKNESFSRVIFEAWFSKKPVIARRSCLATACAVQASGGGWIAEERDEWVDILEQISQQDKSTLETIGTHGKKYSDRVANWDSVINKYVGVLSPMSILHTETYTIRATLESLIEQTVVLRLSGDTLGTFQLRANASENFSKTITNHHSNEQIHLRFETDTDSRNYPPDPRKLSIRILDLSIESQKKSSPHYNFKSGWNRSEGPAEQAFPRWTTGNAELIANFAPPKSKKVSIHQVLPNLGYGDAIGNHAIWIRNRLHSQGYHSEIFARHIAPEMVGEAYVYDQPDRIPSNAIVIYHHSIGTEVTPWVCNHQGPKALIYHNITPPRFYEPYNKQFSKILHQGQDELKLLSKHFPASAGDSKFNAEDLETAGFKSPGVIPLSIDPNKWSHESDAEVMSTYQDGRTNIIFVGRIVPNKRHEELIYLFKFWLLKDPTARLIFVGSSDITSNYLDCLKLLAKKLRVEESVVFTGHVNDEQLLAYYRCASMFWCLSDHEGFCVPVIEAMWFDIPVIAYNSTAVGDTMGDSGFIINDKSRPDLNANRIFKLLSNPSALSELISSQRKRRIDFLPKSNGDNIDNFIERLVSDSE